MTVVRARLGLLLAIALLGACGKSVDGAAAKVAPAPVVVEVQMLKAEPLQRELEAVGSLRSDESVTLRSEISGRLVRIGFREGQAVASGQLLFALEDSVYRAEMDQARASLRLARRNHARAVELYERKLVSQADRDNAAASLDLAQAAAALAEARLAKTRILAPFAGQAGLRQVSPGDYIAIGQELVNLEAMQHMKVDFRVDEAALPVLATGQTLSVEVDAYPGQTFRGELYAIDPRVADSTRSIALRARLDNREGRLRPGLFARIRVQLAMRGDAIVVPEQAVFPRGEQQFAYVMEAGKAALREVRLGERRPGQVEVIGGLKSGETLIVSGLQKLSPGTIVAAGT